MRQLAQMIKKAIPGGKYSNKNNPHEENNSVAQISRKDLGFFFKKVRYNQQLENVL